MPYQGCSATLQAEYLVKSVKERSKLLVQLHLSNKLLASSFVLLLGIVSLAQSRILIGLFFALV